MRSIKPGRAPSWGGVFGGIIALVFGIFWIGMATKMGAPGIFPLFGVVFLLVAIGNIFYNLHNATSKNRFSSWDITEEGEEADPLDPIRRERSQTAFTTGRSTRPKRQTPGAFCPFCGSPAESDHDFCPHCGKDI